MESDERRVKDASIAPRRFTHAKANRIGGRGSFKAILDLGVRSWSGPIGMCIAAQEKSESTKSRLGISIGRPVGNAVKRNRIKRLLRESFRLMQYDWPAQYNVVLLIKPHEAKTLAEYQQIISELAKRCLSKLQPPA